MFYKLIKWSKAVLIMGILVCAIYLAKNIIKTDKWDLMICKTLMEDGVQCYDNSYVLKDYKTQTECMEKGIELAKNEGFECGKNCHESSICGLETGCILECEIVCNKRGCKD